jgi:hypothetical protein
LYKECRDIHSTQAKVPKKERDHNVDAKLIIGTEARCATGDKMPEVTSTNDLAVTKFDKVIEEDVGVAKCILEGFLGFIGGSSLNWHRTKDIV